jgi:hypothetical protein
LGHLYSLEVDKTFILECGRYIGRTLIVRSPSSDPTSIQFDDELVEQGDRILSLSPLLGNCGFIQVERYLVCDTLSAEVLIRIAFNEIFITPNILITAFHCHTSRYILESYAKTWYESRAEISKLTTTQCHDIFVQLVVALHQLNDHQMIFGELDARSILIKNEPPSEKYEGVHIKGPIGVNFAYTPGSSMSIGEIRICSMVTPRVVATVHPKIKIWNVIIEDGKPCTLYSLDAGTRSTFLRHRRSGIPLYPGSLEMYVLLIVLCCETKFFQLITQTYHKMWIKLWLGKHDSKIIQDKVTEWQRVGYQPIYDEIIDLLLGRWLRCDALEVVWDMIRG